MPLFWHINIPKCMDLQRCIHMKPQHTVPPILKWGGGGYFVVSPVMLKDKLILKLYTSLKYSHIANLLVTSQ
jgi:hypothetical protein